MTKVRGRFTGEPGDPRWERLVRLGHLVDRNRWALYLVLAVMLLSPALGIDDWFPATLGAAPAVGAVVPVVPPRRRRRRRERGGADAAACGGRIMSLYSQHPPPPPPDLTPAQVDDMIRTVFGFEPEAGGGRAMLPDEAIVAGGLAALLAGIQRQIQRYPHHAAIVEQGYHGGRCQLWMGACPCHPSRPTPN